jgi:hypothetical protein
VVEFPSGIDLSQREDRHGVKGSQPPQHPSESTQVSTMCDSCSPSPS